jgi:hypothetical protein
MAILDEALGFVPQSKLPSYSNFTVAVDNNLKIFKYSPVIISGGYAIIAAATGGCAGIALHHVDADNGELASIAVCTDASQVFRVKANVVGDITDVGKYVKIIAHTGNNDQSNATVDMTNSTATPTADTPFIVVGWDSDRVTDAAASADLFCLVRLAIPQFDMGLDNNT